MLTNCPLATLLNICHLQFINNYRRQSVEALSAWFLAQWFVGDTLNLLGALLNGQQLATTVMLACYFVLSDVLMLCQYVYYTALQKQRDAYARRMRAKGGKHHRTGSEGTNGHHHHHAHTHTHSVSKGSSSSLYYNVHRHNSSQRLHVSEQVGGQPGMVVLHQAPAGTPQIADGLATAAQAMRVSNAPSDMACTAYAGGVGTDDSPAHSPPQSPGRTQPGLGASKLVVAAIASASLISLGFAGTTAAWGGALQAPPASDIGRMAPLREGQVTVGQDQRAQRIMRPGSSLHQNVPGDASIEFDRNPSDWAKWEEVGRNWPYPSCCTLGQCQTIVNIYTTDVNVAHRCPCVACALCCVFATTIACIAMYFTWHLATISPHCAHRQ